MYIAELEYLPLGQSCARSTKSPRLRDSGRYLIWEGVYILSVKRRRRLWSRSEVGSQISRQVPPPVVISLPKTITHRCARHVSQLARPVYSSDVEGGVRGWPRYVRRGEKCVWTGVASEETRVREADAVFVVKPDNEQSPKSGTLMDGLASYTPVFLALSIFRSCCFPCFFRCLTRSCRYLRFRD